MKDDRIKVPKITYLIRKVILFEYREKLMLLCSFETTNNVLVFEAHNGHFVHEFQFKNSILPLLRHEIIEKIKEQDAQNMEMKMMAQSGRGSPLTPTNPSVAGSASRPLSKQASVSPSFQKDQVAQNAHDAIQAVRMKNLRDKGFFDCRIPEYIKPNYQQTQSKTGQSNTWSDDEQAAISLLDEPEFKKQESSPKEEPKEEEEGQQVKLQRKITSGALLNLQKKDSDEYALKMSQSDMGGGILGQQNKSILLGSSLIDARSDELDTQEGEREVRKKDSGIDIRVSAVSDTDYLN